ncbi:nucleotidyltransferase family protein [Sporosarcina sp. FSL K6-1522]|uniref:nucleotidyltransferase family protein n=1 Tax=Sporosarcina sp. FSL K6-1522 TaxID=2921554 RepID=UPI003159A27D
MKIAGIYLAAGNSSRMGSHKLNLPIGTMTLGSLGLETAIQSSLDTIYIITKGVDDLAWLPIDMKMNAKCTILPCSTAYKGQSESLKCGIQQAQADHMEAVIVMLADQPFITSQMLEEMMTCMKSNPTCTFVATSVDKVTMPPVLLSSSMYADLLTLQGDVGAKSLLQGKFLRKGTILPCADKRLIFDIDTQEDYQSLLAYQEETN